MLGLEDVIVKNIEENEGEIEITILIESLGLREFSSCTKAVHNWSSEILASFDCPYSNGYTEVCNNKTKVLKRVCFGVRSFARLRNRILHCAGGT